MLSRSRLGKGAERLDNNIRVTIDFVALGLSVTK